MWELFGGSINRLRRDMLHLAPTSVQSWNYDDAPAIYGYSAHVIPRPPDWNANARVCGYWFLDAPPDFVPPADLMRFLDAGAPPVYIGFGSMNNRDPEATAALVLDALSQTGQRGVLLTGWSGLHAEDLPDTVFKLDAIPHDWLFPRMAAVVHHGGIGTTAAGLRAGVPSVVVPFFGDQPFWGARVYRLGVGAKPIPRKRLTAARLAEAISTVTEDMVLRERAAALGERIRAEDGVARAVEAVEALTPALRV
jgi:UDP:flavonoid glycosyltransferase YjiC (YdhE family)